MGRNYVELVMGTLIVLVAELLSRKVVEGGGGGGGRST